MMKSPRIARPGQGENSEEFRRYIDAVPGDDALAALRAQIAETVAALASLDPELGRFRYAPEKWSVNEVVGHLADAERVFAYRALTIARGDSTDLPAFDEETWVPMSGAHDRALADLVDELRAVRTSTLALAESLTEAAGRRIGRANGNALSARAAFWCIAGHERHHLAVLRGRYGI